MSDIDIWKTERADMMSAGGWTVRIRTLVAYMDICAEMHGPSFDALRAVTDLESTLAVLRQGIEERKNLRPPDTMTEVERAQWWIAKTTGDELHDRGHTTTDNLPFEME